MALFPLEINLMELAPNPASSASAPNSGKLELELRVTNNPRVLSTVRAFVYDVLHHTSLGEITANNLSQLIMARVSDAIENAYPPGESGTIAIQTSHDKDSLVISVRDYGLPQDIQKLEASLHRTDTSQQQSEVHLDCLRAADDLHWISYGPHGKALQITKWLHEVEITAHPDAGDLKPFHSAPPLASEQEYEIRRMRPDEAVQVSQLIYKAYGSSYFNSDVYYPDRVAALNERGEVLSFVAAGADGKLVGHYALERNQSGPVAEGGQAVVDPAHRGRKLLERMKDAAIAEARKLGLVGTFGDAVTVHKFSQKMDIAHGARLACANLGIAPRTEKFRGIGEEQPQRITCLLYFLWLSEPSPQTVFAPDNHREAVDKLYKNLGCPVTIEPGKPPEGHGELIIELDTGAVKAMLRAKRVGEDTAVAIRHAKRALIERSHAETVFVELPLTQSGTPATALELEKEGFSFIGIAPRFSPEGDLLRMVYLTDELKREPIQVEEEIGRWLVDYALAERARVSE